MTDDFRTFYKKMFCPFCGTEMIKGCYINEWEDKEYGFFCTKCEGMIIHGIRDGWYLCLDLYDTRSRHDEYIERISLTEEDKNNIVFKRRSRWND